MGIYIGRANNAGDMFSAILASNVTLKSQKGKKLIDK
jgi:hypothetical protein